MLNCSHDTTADIFNVSAYVADKAYLPFVPISIGEFSCKANYFAEFTERTQCLLVYTYEGRGVVHYRSEDKTVSKGDLFVLNCAHYQHYTSDISNGWRFLWLLFEGCSASKYVDWINQDGFTVAHGDFESDVRALFESIRLHNSESLADASLGIHKLLRSLHAEPVQIVETKCSPKVGDAIRTAAAYIEEHYRENISLETLAEIASLSKYYFLRLFSAETGTTPYEYLLRMRIGKAQKLLATTDMSVEEIALEAGFCDSKNLITHFRKRTGATPLQFRKELPFR